MMVDVVPCWDCKWWGDCPRMGDAGKAWSRCRLTGCTVDSEFFCKHGKRETNTEEKA